MNDNTTNTPPPHNHKLFALPTKSTITEVVYTPETSKFEVRVTDKTSTGTDARRFKCGMTTLDVLSKLLNQKIICFFVVDADDFESKGQVIKFTECGVILLSDNLIFFGPHPTKISNQKEWMKFVQSILIEINTAYTSVTRVDKVIETNEKLN